MQMDPWSTSNMHLVARLAAPHDFSAMMRLCRTPAHDVAENRAEWDTLWDSSGTCGVIIEDLSLDAQDRVRALMITTIVTDDFLEQSLVAKEPFILGKIRRDPRVLLRANEVGPLNARSGINQLIAYLGWEGETYHVEPAPNLRAVVVNAYADRHGGYRLKYLLGEVGGPALVDLISRTGGAILNDYAEWAAANGQLEAPKRPYLMGTTREDALRSENQWLTRLFTYFPPVFGFTELQRQILVLAREGHTDAEIGELLNVTADAVKKRWSGIYDRVTEVFPRLLPESPMGGRGAEKRRALISHLRERPEELRAYGDA